MLRRASLSVVASFLLLGCGGGGSDSNDTVENASVNAGSDFSVEEKAEFTLSAIGSPAGGTYTWQVMEGPSMEGFPQEGKELKLAAPDVKTDTSATIKVEYLAPSGVLVSDTVTIAIGSRNQLPIPHIKKTLPDRDELQYKDEITLSADESKDPDENGKIIEYLWEQVSGPELTFERNDQITLKFIHPLLSANDTARFKLTLTDDEGGQSSTEFSLTLYKNDRVVFAEAGEDIKVIEFDKGVLDASNSISASGSYTCEWSLLDELVEGAKFSIDNPNKCTTNFSAPSFDSVSSTGSSITMQVTVYEPGGYKDIDTVKVYIQELALGKNFNDTGQVDCYDLNEKIDCNNDGFPNQDAELGKDSFIENQLKVGDGLASFDFTKLDENGFPVSGDTFSCVKDNVTGLIWEVKEFALNLSPRSLRDSRHVYTWHIEGLPNGHRGTDTSKCVTNGLYCDTQQYITEVNNYKNPDGVEVGYCGGTNWRLPTFVELLGILNYGEETSHFLDPTYFPNTAAQSLLGHSRYWTSQTSIEGASGQSDLSEAYVIDMATGKTPEIRKASSAYIRLVREAN